MSYKLIHPFQFKTSAKIIFYARLHNNKLQIVVVAILISRHPSYFRQPVKIMSVTWKSHIKLIHFQWSVNISSARLNWDEELLSDVVTCTSLHVISTLSKTRSRNNLCRIIEDRKRLRRAWWMRISLTKFPSSRKCEAIKVVNVIA